MKPIVKKILESGLVEKHAAKMLENWGNLDPGSADMVGQQALTQKNLESFLEDIEELLAKREDVEIKETVFGMEVTVESFTTKETGLIHCNQNKLGQYIVPGDDTFLPGQLLWPRDRPIRDPAAMITNVDTVWGNDHVSYTVLTVDDTNYQRLRALRMGTDPEKR